MRKFFKRTLLLLCCVICLSLINCDTAHANTAGKSLSYDPLTECFVFQSKDKAATSSIRYQTIGFYISRCPIGQKAEYGDGTQFIKIDLYGETGKLVENVGGQVVHKWLISKDDILQKIQAKGYTEWYNEVSMAYSQQLSESYYLKFDAIMVTKKPKNGSYILSGMMGSNNWDELGNPAYSVVESKTEKQRCYNKFSITDLKNAYPWASPSSIDNHFHLYYEITGNPTPPDPIPPIDGEIDREEWVIRVGKATPDFVTYNTSSDGKFHIGEAIPTTEHVSNYAEADQWYGYADIGMHNVTRTYTFPIRYSERVNVFNASGHCVASYDVPVNENVVLSDTVSYYYLQDVKLYDLQSVTVKNGVYPADAQYTSASDVNVQCIVLGDETAHVTKPVPNTALITKSTQAQCINEAKARFESAKMTAKNDYLSINGAVVLDDNIVNTSNVYHKHMDGCYKKVYCGSTSYTKVLNTSNGDPYQCQLCGIGRIEYQNYEREDYSCINNYGMSGGFSFETCPTCGQTRSYQKDMCGTCYHTVECWINYCTCTPQNGHPTQSWTPSKHDHTVQRYICNHCGKNYGTSLPAYYDYTCTKCGMLYENQPDMTMPECTYVVTDTSILVCGLTEGWATNTNSYAYNEIDLTNQAILPTEYFSNEWMQIPARKANGSYPTEIYATYQNILTGEIVNHSRGQLSNNHIKAGYEMNEPIIVHTPIICPFHIEGAETETQLINETPDVYQLMLDGYYTFRFDSYVHSSNFGYENVDGDVTRYDKYISNKAVRFPFSILYNGIYYNKTDTGYTEWIVLDKDSGEWESGNFYIPTWAEETQNATIQIMVVAINATGENGEDRTDQIEDEESSNVDLNDYVLIFDEAVQLSGRIYDFQVVGITDREMFSTSDAITQSYSFVNDRAEKKLGGYNRLGNPVVRYTLDKALCNHWLSQNTLPFCNGKGLNGLGTLWKGTTFSFSVKTMANLWDVGALTSESGTVTDQVRITPSYRYVTKDGAGNVIVRDDIDIYYHNYNGDKPMLYTKMGSDADLSTRCLVNLADGSFDGSYTWKDVQYSVDKLNQWTGKAFKPDAWLKRDRESYNMASIILNSDLRLLTGYEEEMQVNLEKDSAVITRYADDFAFKDRFDYSIQTWYGSYYIPSTLLVAPKNIDVNKDGMVTPTDLDVDGNGTIDYYSDDMDRNGVVDLTDYALVYGLTDESDVWLPTTDAYLVLNFDIITVNDGAVHLSYYGSTLDMWARETYKGNVTPSKDPLIDPTKPDTPTNRPPYTSVPVSDGLNDPLDPPIDIPIVTGDVAIIDLDDSTGDRYNAGIFFIN